ncbi:MAG: hypothetical protein AAF721_24160 [Myxococcota bacterium]
MVEDDVTPEPSPQDGSATHAGAPEGVEPDRASTDGETAGESTGESTGDASAGDPSDALTDVPQTGIEDSDFGPPFAPKTFGGAFVWARGESYTTTVLRVKEGENVVVSTQGRTDMVVMLTGGRAVLEVGLPDGDIDRVELMPASPVNVDADKSYRLLAVTEVELFTVFSPLRA